MYTRVRYFTNVRFPVPFGWKIEGRTPAGEQGRHGNELSLILANADDDFNPLCLRN